MIPGGMSDLPIPPEDPQDCTCETRQACYCYDNGHTGEPVCVACGADTTTNKDNTSQAHEQGQVIRQCDGCGQSYVKSRLGDHGLCRACEIAEQGIRNMIADEMKPILRDYEQAVLERIRNIMR